MNAAAIPTAGPRRLVWAFVVVAVLAQVGFIFWLGDDQPVVPRRVTAAPRLSFAPDHAGEMSTLADPTLFVWASPRGFSGAAWLRVPPLEYQSAEWTEPPRFLELQTAQLGNGFRHLIQGNAAPSFEIEGKPEVSLATSSALATTSIPARSAVRVEGDLAARRLRTRFDLPSLPVGDVLPDSVVQVMVDARGRVLSATLLSSSGAKDADAQALNLAKSAWWEPISPDGGNSVAGNLSALTWGQLVFSWHTVPLSATNPPRSNP